MAMVRADLAGKELAEVCEVFAISSIDKAIIFF
jgi:hypothetical protein